MTAYADRPWLGRYGNGMPADLTIEFPSLLAAFRSTLERGPGRTAIRYFDGEMTFSELSQRSDALAVALLENGFNPGDRLAIFVQNNPAFVVALLAAWKAGGSAVAVNPMNRKSELSYILSDSGASFLVCLDELHQAVAAEVVASGETEVRVVVTCSSLDDQSRDDQRLFSASSKLRPKGTLDLGDVIDSYRGRSPELLSPSPSDLAMLTYTSGTTGVPKGAMNTHGNLAFNSQTYRDWMRLSEGDSILGVAPLFHITGLVGHVGVALLAGLPLVLAHRFEPGVVLDAIREHRPTFTVGAITVFINLISQSGVTAEDFSSFRALYSGGAPIAPAVVEHFKAKTGLYIHNIYGLTETNSPSHIVPLGAEAPVDENSGALSIGVPCFNTMVRILGEDGKELPVGEVGEMAISGPQVVPGYWNKPEATAESLPGGELRTGDVGFMDEQGWFYIVDRKKDMINASGYKVWPREVEDVLYKHQAVREAAVVGVPDAYRGETVKAFVSLKPGESVTEEDLIAFCKERMAAYKYPRSIVFMEELPKTTSGKLLRRELRASAG